MNSSGMRAFFLLISFSFLGGGVLRFQAQVQTHNPEKEFKLRVPVAEVVVPVTVLDGEGRPALGLQKEDFALYEDEIPQVIRRFSVDPAPLSIAILIDTSTDVLTQTMIKENLVPLVETLSPFDEAAVWQFEHVPDLHQGFTSDKEVLLQALRKLTLGENAPAFDGSMGPFGSQPTLNGIPIGTGVNQTQPPKTLNTHIDDAVFSAAQVLRSRARDRRKIILLISNGQNAPGNRHSFDGTIEAVLTGEIVVFGIGQGTSVASRRMGNRVARYARDTGGEVFYPVKSASFAESLQRISLTARNQYVLGFVSSAQADKVTYRKISVEILREKGKSFKVRNRKGYFAVPVL
jgi:VWFA-related protein